MTGAGFDDRPQTNSLDEISTIQAAAIFDDAEHIAVELVPCPLPGCLIYMSSNLCKIHTDNIRKTQSGEPNDKRSNRQHMICELKTC